MTTNFEKLTKNADIVKGTNFDNINKANHNVSEAEKKTFAHTLKVAELMAKANEYFVSKECKSALKNCGLDGIKKEVFFKELFGFERAYTFRLIKAGKIAPEVIQQFKASNNRQSLIELLKFANIGEGEGEGEGMNTTAEGITEKSETEKPAKFSTTKKGIDIKVNSGVTAEDIAEAIAYLQSLQK